MVVLRRGMDSRGARLLAPKVVRMTPFEARMVELLERIAVALEALKPPVIKPEPGNSIRIREGSPQ